MVLRFHLVIILEGGGPVVDVIVAALAAGASAGVSGTATEAIKDGYTLLKALIRRRFAGRDQARAALEAEETEPGVWQASIGEALEDSGAAIDEHILEAARELLALVEPGRAATFNISGTVHGAAGQFNAPVSFDQRTQLPPAPPVAG
ncbi:hypothetical protein KOI35_11125 [Actinoplanes bogorensis]|uniref:Uncharacterized protein n=1 Tax=Paractinoplanes bogorensis TaxID=1610840 RepID=A0ABS5YKT8_9ACTN|nr:hypothetical protein [Actinoplanes bogorensis]MBU2664042.1 hypothetical protein [Actinoplanes bogorensis]